MNMILCFVSHLIQLKQYLKSSGHTICTGFGHDLSHTISKFLFPPIEQTARGKESNGFCWEVSCWGYPLSHSHAQTVRKKKKKSGYMLDVPTILVARLPSEEISLSQRRLLWTELSLFSCVTPILQFVRIAEISRVKFRWRTLKSSRLKFLSCPWRSLTTPDPFILESKQEAAATNWPPKTCRRQWRVKNMSDMSWVWQWQNL